MEIVGHVTRDVFRVRDCPSTKIGERLLVDGVVITVLWCAERWQWVKVERVSGELPPPFRDAPDVPRRT